MKINKGSIFINLAVLAVLLLALGGAEGVAAQDQFADLKDLKPARISLATEPCGTIVSLRNLPKQAIASTLTVPSTIKVLMDDDSVVEMDLDEYLKGVVAAEMYADWPIEALKAQAVAARTFAVNNTHHDHSNVDVCTKREPYIHCQAWNPPPYAARIEEAVTATHNVVITYNGEIITEALFFSHCDGHTRNIEDYEGWGYQPYLRSVPCDCASTYGWSEFPATAHGVGMCQYGAEVMATERHSYVDILKHYYTGVEITTASTADAPDQVIDLKDVKPEVVKGHPKLQSVLDQLVTAHEEGQMRAFAEQRSMEVKDDRIRVVIEAVPGKEDSVIGVAEALGADVETSYENLAQAVVPVSQLKALADDANVKLVRLPFRLMPMVTSEGVSLINADAWHSAGFTGSGEKVGILDGGFSGYASLLGTELPASVTTWSAPSVTWPGSSVHGTACAEIVYDLVPNAQFYLVALNYDTEFPAAVDWLIGQGVDVISSSIGWYLTGPGDGTGPICDKVTDARNAGILWANAAGNQAEMHWSGTWQGEGDNYHNFGPTDESNAIVANNGDEIYVGLRWDDPWGTSGNDYNLWLANSDPSPVIVASSTTTQDGDDYPRESLSYTATYTGIYHIIIYRVSATRDVDFDLLTFRHNLQYQVASGSLIEPADSPDAMTVGAVDWNNPGTLEYYSSRGATTDSRIKPDVVAPSRVSTSTYGAGGFAGTSAAAPHGAGAAVLVKDCFPSYTPAQIQSYLEANAVDLGSPGKDNLHGSGRLSMPAIAGRDTFGIFYPGGTWYLDDDGDCFWDRSLGPFGVPWGVTPVTGDWNGDGKDTFGIFYPGGTWYLDDDGDCFWDRSLGPFGVPWGVTPVTGDWNGE